MKNGTGAPFAIALRCDHFDHVWVVKWPHSETRRLARMLEQPGMTTTGEFMGSPLYMSPEQITAGRAPLDHRADIYSLGATLYELLTLQPPFIGERRDQIIGQIMHKEPRPPRSALRQTVSRSTGIFLLTRRKRTPTDAEDLRPDRRRSGSGART